MVSTAMSVRQCDTQELTACDGLIHQGSTDLYTCNFDVGDDGAVIQAFGLDGGHYIELEAVNNRCCPHEYETFRLIPCNALVKSAPQMVIPYPGTYRFWIKGGNPGCIGIYKIDLKKSGDNCYA